MLLYLVRHGETDWNRQRRIQGSTDIPLNGTGRQQAHATARLLARRRWDAVFSSPLSRAFETASIIAAELGLPQPTPLDALVERSYGQAEGFTDRELDRLFPGDTPVPGREAREDVTERVLPALLGLASSRPGERVVVVSHGGVIRAVLGAIEPEGEYGAITNGSVHSFRYDDGSLSLVAFDDPIEFASGDGEDVRAQNAMERRG